eukprot:TRINITY_DN58763_c0_g1_i1.p1 TRINITY_DN58763_c0_g1~~TRINITY_DN58763_c0_g1_i1.p1  ORF type:complete len:191 (+),score=17.96 TRINITY_DN58763_c0_g1_i1:61-633(+)
MVCLPWRFIAWLLLSDSLQLVTTFCTPVEKVPCTDTQQRPIPRPAGYVEVAPNEWRCASGFVGLPIISCSKDGGCNLRMSISGCTALPSGPRPVQYWLIHATGAWHPVVGKQKLIPWDVEQKLSGAGGLSTLLQPFDAGQVVKFVGAGSCTSSVASSKRTPHRQSAYSAVSIWAESLEKQCNANPSAWWA